MTNQRLSSIVSEARRAKDYLKKPHIVRIERKRLKPEYANTPAHELPQNRHECWEGTGEFVLHTLPARGSIQRNLLPKVSLSEHSWLCQNIPGLARFTRAFDYDDDVYIEDSDLMVPARKANVKEIWVGARTVACIGETEQPEGHQFMQAEQEDASELTELLTLTYDDAAGFNRWYKRTISNACRACGKRANDFKWRNHFAALIEDQFMRDRYGAPIKCMLTDDRTGEYRPVRVGDLITTAHGSNENLDALYMDEPTDPRCESDAIIRELTRDRINPASEFEHDLHTFKERRNGRTLSEMVIPSHGEEANEPGADEHYYDDIYLRRIANHKADEMLEAMPILEREAVELRDSLYRDIRARHGALRTQYNSEEGTNEIVRGSFKGPKDIFDENEGRIRTLERHLSRKQKLAAMPMDWKLRAKGPSVQGTIPAWVAETI